MHRRVQVQVFYCPILEYHSFIKKMRRYNWEIVHATLLEGGRKEIRFIVEKEV
jgi:hypothetical protein